MALQIAVVAFAHISPFHLSVPTLVFGDSQLQAVMPVTLQVCAEQVGPLPTTGGFDELISHDWQVLADAEVIIIPSWPDITQPPPGALLQALQAAHQRGAQLVGLCLGAFVLAEAGLLEGHPATTHWAYAKAFAARYPTVRLDADVLYCDAGQVVTSAGVSAGLDCCLHLVRQRAGSTVANQIARRLVIPPHRQGGQAQFIDQPVPDSARDLRLSGLLEWLQQHLADEHTLDALAAQALMSRRSFSRHFHALTGMSVGAWLLQARLQRCQILLEHTSLGLAQIAEQTGLGSVVNVRQHFQRAFGVSPMQWRRTFVAPAH